VSRSPRPANNYGGMTISAFCEKEGISRTQFYRLEKAGMGPAITNASPVGFRPIILQKHYESWRARRDKALAEAKKRQGDRDER